MMRNGSMHSEHFEFIQSQSEVDDLLAALLEAETTYPWDPTELQTEAYLETLEQEFSLADWEPKDLQLRSQDFFAQIDRLWLKKTLAQHFAERMPEQLLNQIVQQAQKLFQSPLSLAEQLVECVQEVLPTWNVEDLQVLARPLAYAMRDFETESTTVVDATLKAVRPVAWTELSELEQARLSLSVARYALGQLHQTTGESASPQ